MKTLKTPLLSLLAVSSILLISSSTFARNVTVDRYIVRWVQTRHPGYTTVHYLINEQTVENVSNTNSMFATQIYIARFRNNILGGRNWRNGFLEIFG